MWSGFNQTKCSNELNMVIISNECLVCNMLCVFFLFIWVVWFNLLKIRPIYLELTVQFDYVINNVHYVLNCLKICVGHKCNGKICQDIFYIKMQKYSDLRHQSCAEKNAQLNKKGFYKGGYVDLWCIPIFCCNLIDHFLTVHGTTLNVR